MENFLKALPIAATNPLALIAYLVTLLVWGMIALNNKRISTLLQSIDKFPEEDRRKIVSEEMNVVLPEKISPKEWLHEKKQRYLLIGFIVLIISILVFSAMVIYQARAFAGSSPHLVDASFIETDQFPKIDIKVRNTGDKITFFKQIDINVKKIWVLHAPCEPSEIPVSWNYDVLLPTDNAPYTKTVDISQAVKPNDVDRFTLTLGNDSHDAESAFVYLINLNIIADENNQTLTSQDMLFSESGAAAIQGEFCANFPDIIRNNKKAANEIEHTDGIKSERLQQIIDEINKS